MVILEYFRLQNSTYPLHGCVLTGRLDVVVDVVDCVDIAVPDRTALLTCLEVVGFEVSVVLEIAVLERVPDRTITVGELPVLVTAVPEVELSESVVDEVVSILDWKKRPICIMLERSTWKLRPLNTAVVVFRHFFALPASPERGDP